MLPSIKAILVEAHFHIFVFWKNSVDIKVDEWKASGGLDISECVAKSSY